MNLSRTFPITARSAVASVVLTLTLPLHAQPIAPAPLSLQALQTDQFPPQFANRISRPPDTGTYQLAPMPNSDLNAPLPPTPKAEVQPHLFSPSTQFRGDGFSPGSTIQSWQEQKLRPAPGVSLKVPLE